MEIQSVIVCTVLGKENRTHLTCQKGSCSLDKRIKNHYTTNRKGAGHNGQLLARSVKKIDRLSLRRSIFFVIIVFLLVKLVHDLNGQTDHVHDQSQKTENDHEERESLHQIHPTSLPSPSRLREVSPKKFHSRNSVSFHVKRKNQRYGQGA
jgi:hypothetical protein